MSSLERRESRGGASGRGRWIVAAVMVLIALVGYYGARSYSPETDAGRPVSLSPQQEVALGLQGAPVLAERYGGLYPDQEARQRVDRICHELVEKTEARETEYPFDCHVLADEETIDAFALPGGQVFLTAGLLRRLRTEAQLAGVLAHGIGHVVARHATERVAGQEVAPGLTGAEILTSYDPDDPASRLDPGVAKVVERLVDLRFNQQDELEADRLGARFLADAGYEPRAMADAMRVLAENGGSRPPELFSTHPSPEDRLADLD